MKKKFQARATSLAKVTYYFCRKVFIELIAEIFYKLGAEGERAYLLSWDDSVITSNVKLKWKLEPAQHVTQQTNAYKFMLGWKILFVQNSQKIQK